MEQMEANCQEQLQQSQSLHAEASASQQELGQKPRKVEELEHEDRRKQQKIEQLEQQLEDYKAVCSYVTSQTQPPAQQQAGEAQGNSPAPTASSSQVINSEAQAAPENSVAEGAAGLLAMASTADKADLQVEASRRMRSDQDEQEWPQLFTPSSPNKKQKLGDMDMDTQDPRPDSVPRRATCFIEGRHPQAPGEVRVACKQLTGTLLLGHCCQELKIRAPSVGNKLLSPSGFETEAGCSKGRNWKANIKVLGSNGHSQTLKVWLPSLVLLLGDHSKSAIAKDTDIKSFSDPETGLKLMAATSYHECPDHT